MVEVTREATREATREVTSVWTQWIHSRLNVNQDLASNITYSNAQQAEGWVL